MDRINPVFSFRYYDLRHKDFSIKCLSHAKDLHELIERLHVMSTLKWGEIKKSAQYHCHDVVWPRTHVPGGFKALPAEVIGFPAWQFKAFKECRVFGFFNNNNAFEIVWIDRGHLIYKRK